VRLVVAALGWGCALALALVVRRLRARLELVARAEHELRGPLTAFGLALHAARGTPAGRRLGALLEAELARARAGLDDLAAARSGSGRPRMAAREPVRADDLLRSSGAAWDTAARARGRRLRVRAGGIGGALVRCDRSRLAQALGNVMSNAVEHGSGDVSVSATRSGSRLRIEVTNPTAAPPPPGSEPPSGPRPPGSAPPSGSVPPPSPAERGRGLRIAADAVAGLGGRLSSTIDGSRARTILDLPLER
jgi:signal transduction histidine kinase